MPEQPKIRLFIEHDLSEGRSVSLTSDQAHYLGSVMRRKVGDGLRAFNGRDGEWLMRINALSRKTGDCVAEIQTRSQTARNCTRLLMAPLKKTRFDFAVEKATELGVGCISPVFTTNTDTGRVNTDRLRALVREAAEQCERLDCPVIEDAVPLSERLTAWPDNTLLFFADETGSGDPLSNVLKEKQNIESDHAFLIGPEGGFSAKELEFLKSLPFSLPIGLGPRILRAETAVCAVLSIYQTIAGDGAERPLSD